MHISLMLTMLLRFRVPLSYRSSCYGRCFASSPSSSTAITSPTPVSRHPYILLFDGGSRGNPGIAGAGAALYKVTEPGSQFYREVWSGSYYLGDSKTNNYAEYAGLIQGLKYLVAQKIPSVEIQGDSLLVIKQMLGEYKVINPRLQILHRQAKRLIFKLSNYRLRHIARGRNFRADELANIAMDSRNTFEKVSVGTEELKFEADESHSLRPSLPIKSTKILKSAASINMSSTTVLHKDDCNNNNNNNNNNNGNKP